MRRHSPGDSPREPKLTCLLPVRPAEIAEIAETAETADPGSILRSNYVKPRFFIDIFEGPEKRV